MYSETVREPQLVITTPGPCGHYEATVTPMCGSITGAQTSPVELESKFKGDSMVVCMSRFICCDENSMLIFEQICLVIYI